MHHAANLKFDSPSSADPHRDDSIMEEAKYPPMDYSSPIGSAEHRKDSMQSNVTDRQQPLTSSSASNQSTNSNALHPIIKEDEALEEDMEHHRGSGIIGNESAAHFDMQRSQGMVLKPNKAAKKLSHRMPYSMPSKIQTLRSLNG